MAKINRFYLLISMLVSYRIGTAMAVGIRLEFGDSSSMRQYCALEYWGAENPCHVCVPTTPPSGAAGWEQPGETQSWAYEACSDNECSKTIGGQYGSPVFYKVGVRVPALTPTTNQESSVSYYECTNDGWIAGDYDDPNAGGSGGGDDTPISCSAGYYAQTKTGPCVKCPSASFYNAEYEEETYVPLGNAEGTSKAGATDIYQCYIASPYPYMDNKGVFKFTNDCYYGS